MLDVDVLELIHGRTITRLLPLVWLAVAFLFVRMASHGEFTWGGFASAYEQDALQFATLASAAAGSLFFALRAIRRRDPRIDVPGVAWGVLVTIVGGALWRLGHDSAPAIMVLAVLGGLIACLSPGARRAG